MHLNTIVKITNKTYLPLQQQTPKLKFFAVNKLSGYRLVFKKEAKANVTHKSDQAFETCKILAMGILPRICILPHPPLPRYCNSDHKHDLEDFFSTAGRSKQWI